MAETRQVLGLLGQALAWLVILGVTVVLAVAVLVPRLAGASPYTILTGSMQPSYPPGTLVVVKPTPASEIAAGDVITYQLVSGRASVVTHRVKTVHHSLGGGTTFTTQGDANDVADAKPVRPVQVRGTLWYSVPHLGHVNTMLNGRERQMAVYVVAALLLGYAAFMLVSGARESRSARRTPRQPRS